MKMKSNIARLHHRIPIPTTEGSFVAHYSGLGLCGLEFPSSENRRDREEDAAQPKAQVRRWHATASKALRRTLAGRAPKQLPPLDLSAGTEFQQQVWRALRKIGWGRTWSYRQVAQAIGKPKAVRAVGGACGANPIPVFVPCHRVLAADNTLGGFSAGLNWKRALLAREGIRRLASERE